MIMTVEAKYLELMKEGDTEFIANDSQHNDENIYPMSGELMVAIRPLISNCNFPLISKINIPKAKELNEKLMNRKCEKDEFGKLNRGTKIVLYLKDDHKEYLEENKVKNLD